MVVVLGVMALHVALMVWLGRAAAWRAPSEQIAHPSPMVVRLLDHTSSPSTSAEVRLAPAVEMPDATMSKRHLPAMKTATTVERETAARPSRAEAAHERGGLPATPPTSQTASTSPRTPATTPTTPATAAAAAIVDSGRDSGPARALDLRLPFRNPTRPTARNPLLDDPRAHTARTTPEQRMTTSFDTRVIRETLNDGRLRVRQGDSCVIVSPARAGELFAADGTGRSPPSTVVACP